ncbi:MAG TPA: hypothetical protein VKD72_08155, partial [Gemmataceae bacterium]|nr:hypothetical protein [Gemmataceae bacterium]
EARRSAEDLETALASLSETFTDLGRVQTRWGDLDAAIRAFQRACFLVEERVRETRSVPLQAALVQGYTFLGVLRQKNKQPDLAAEAYGKAARLVAKLSAGPPDEIANRADYGQTCYALAVALREFQRPPAERLVAAQQGVFHLSMVLRKNPANKELRTATSVAYFELGDVQRKLGQLAASASTALERQKLWPDNPDQVYDVACELARCMAAVGQGKARLTPAEQAERRRYGDLAMLVLEQAVKMGLKDVAAAAHDDDLAPLRDRDDFRKLISGQKR